MATSTPLGNLIKNYRQKAGMTIKQLNYSSNVDRGNLSRIESGDVKRPCLETVQKLSSVLKIPSGEMVKEYLQVEGRADVLFAFLDDLIQKNDISMIPKVATKILQSSSKKSEDLIEMLYEKATNLENPAAKLPLYQLISRYSTDHGIMSYIAKGLLQAYLIERDDFPKFRSTYASGKGVLFFKNCLSSEEKGLMYYKLGVHAFYLCLFEESVDLGIKALDSKIEDDVMRANTIYFVCNCYFYLGNYEKTEEYLAQYKEYSLPKVKENTKITESMLHSANGNYQLAISILQDSLPCCGDDTLLHVVNHLITLYLKVNDLPKIQDLIQLEGRLLTITFTTPFQKAELAHYFKLRGNYFILTGRIESGIDSYLEAAIRYAKVDFSIEESVCLEQIMNIYFHNKKSMDLLTVGKLATYHNYKGKEIKYEKRKNRNT